MSRKTSTSIGALLGAFVLVAPAAPASEIGHEIVAQIREETYRYYMDTQLFTRVGHSRGPDGAQHDLARDNIAAIFQSFGLEVELEPFEGYPYSGVNVVATQFGMVYPEAQYIVGAHYDSVDNPGADDDASGVAGLLEIARVLSAYETEYTVKYIAFDLEDSQGCGSCAYVDEHLDDDMRGMVQLDMIAWDWGTYKCLVGYHGIQSPPWAEELQQAVEEYGGDLIVRYISDRIGGSDHMAFGNAGVPACLLIENRPMENPSYHRLSDSVDNPGYICYGYAIDMTRSAAGFLADHALAHHPYDCDGDGVPDADEIQSDPSLDCNGNHILDVCEFAGDQDLNENGVPDLCDIHAGTSGDCNGNWVPDEVEPGYERDCNENGTPDLCDLASHASADLNVNDIPDECELHGTIYVDDDAPNDPGPGDPEISDPDEDGSLDHPFDAISEAMAIAVSGDEILVRAGVYFGAQNRNMSTQGRGLRLGGEDGPETCIIDLEQAGSAFDLVYLTGPDVVIEGLSFVNGNRALNMEDGAPSIANCIFANNHNDQLWRVGAVRCYLSNATFSSCLFIGNSAWQGAAAYCYGAPAVLFRGCTFVGNEASAYGGAITLRRGCASLTNCVLWGNSAELGPQLAVRDGASLTLAYSDLDGGAESIWLDDDAVVDWGPGNIDADPLFADPNNGDLHLLPGSPCIDAGANALVPQDYADLDQDGDVWELTPLDLDYEGRFFDDPNTPDTGCGSAPIVDMGAYEFGGTGPVPCIGDLNGDGMVSLFDLAQLLSGYGVDDAGDLDCDGDTDSDDLTALLVSYGDTCP